MPKLTYRQSSTLVQQEFPLDSSRARRAENRDLLKRTMGLQIVQQKFSPYLTLEAAQYFGVHFENLVIRPVIEARLQ